jgi:hypothetical protein
MTFAIAELGVCVCVCACVCGVYVCDAKTMCVSCRGGKLAGNVAIS